MSLLEALLTRPAPVKAATGIGATWMTYNAPLAMMTRDPRKRCAEAQAIGRTNDTIRAAERVIGDKFSTVPWHLTDGEGNKIDDDSPEGYRAIIRMLEHPYAPKAGEPVAATPSTRSGLWRITSKHMGLCGPAFWVLDQIEQLGHTPLQLLYVNPARMTPALNDHKELIGWVVDADTRAPMQFSPDEVLVFNLEPPDEGFTASGLVETALVKAEIERLVDRHVVGVMGSGGRLAGVFSPPAAGGAIPEEQFAQLQKDVRTVAESPDASRRALLLRGPIEFTKTAASPAELDLVALANMGHERLLELWGVPKSQLAGLGSVGMNSGEAKAYDEAALWQNAVGPRLRAFAEVLQFQLLDRFARLGLSVQLVIEEPTFDDEAPRYEYAVKAQNQPLTNDERRAIMGYAPFADEVLGRAIWMPINIGPAGEASPAAKARMGGQAIAAARQAIVDVTRRSAMRILGAMAASIAKQLREKALHIATHLDDESAWWQEERWTNEWTHALSGTATLAVEAAGERAASLLGPPPGASGKALSDAVMARLLRRAGERITDLNQTTREGVLLAVREAVDAGVTLGESTAEIGKRIAAIKVQGLPVFDASRGELIARTETMRAWNGANIETYRDYGVGRVTADDGDFDVVCSHRNGQVFTLDDALAIEEHPNGTLDFVPLVDQRVS